MYFSFALVGMQVANLCFLINQEELLLLPIAVGFCISIIFFMVTLLLE